ncbi:PIN domain-containing protein [Rhabdothermincola salaria]|uniref:PIN domain-containing protein n=1 Tax=Rhabdothermincola salaria TaxID=2903142 RepID=UPI001E4646E7|nr:PIN domain-containing protein [Rhabdothermincola salaria]
MSVVLDSWAVLRLLEDDGPAARTVEELLERDRPVISWINLGEVFYVLRRLHGDDAARSTVRDVRDAVEARLPDERLVLDAARIKSEVAMSYADAFAAAQAVALDAELWTGDPELLVKDCAWRWRDLRTT